MAGERISIYAGPPIAALLAGAENRSGRLNDVAERYTAIVADELRRSEFSRGEWCAIMDTLNGVQIEVEGTPDWRFSWAEMADSPEMDQKWGIDHADLARRLKALPTAGKAAVHEAAAAFWRHSDLPTDEALRLAGVAPRS